MPTDRNPKVTPASNICFFVWGGRVRAFELPYVEESNCSTKQVTGRRLIFATVKVKSLLDMKDLKDKK